MVAQRFERRLPAGKLRQRVLGRLLQARKVVGVVGDEVLDLLARRRARPPGAAAAEEVEHVAGARRQLLGLGRPAC